MPTRTAPPEPTRPTPRRAAPPARPALRPAAPRPAPSAAQAARKAGAGARLPGWDDLAPRRAASGARAEAGARKAQQLAARKASVRPLDAAPSLRFALGVLLVCLAATLFVAHVYATRATLAELQAARRDGERLRLSEQRLRGERDRMLGPANVMPRALALGLVEGVAYGVPVTLPAAAD